LRTLIDHLDSVNNKDSGEKASDLKGTDLEWVQGKTVVLYADSVLRFNLDHFCKVSDSG
jgi:hypothetical protein